MLGKLKILIVEDEARIARFVQLELRHEGFDTSTESNGRLALERILKEKFDLVLLDIMLPELDGMEICRRVRQSSNVPIIMLTAKDDVSDKVQGLDIGANDYLTKPFAMAELLARIRATLRDTNHN
ncbi:MAG: response regulator [Selenomonadaceae bacterium]|nr:response regulator [Selenomonadaceae bacterium]